jgi:hypothetical protein
MLSSFTKSGRETPSALARRIEAMPISLYLSASELSRSSSWDLHFPFEETKMGPTRRLSEMMVKNLNEKLCDIVILQDIRN